MAHASDSANERALIFAGLGDRDRALEALHEMGDTGPQRIGRYLEYPEFGLMRDDPRLMALRRSIGLCGSGAAGPDAGALSPRCIAAAP